MHLNITQLKTMLQQEIAKDVIADIDIPHEAPMDLPPHSSASAHLSTFPATEPTVQLDH